MTSDRCEVLFIEEKGQRSKVYDFLLLEADPQIQQWLARSFSRAVGDTAGAKRVTYADALWGTLQKLTEYLEGRVPVPRAAGEISAKDIKEFFLTLPMGSRKHLVERMRTIFREDHELSVEARNAVLHGRLPVYESKVQPYSNAEHQELMTAVRHDIRVARDRIYEGRELLNRYRRGGLGVAHRLNNREKTGRALDFIDRTGDLPRRVLPSSVNRSGDYPGWVSTIGGARRLFAMLTLTPREVAAFCLQLVDLTAENFGTVAKWPAVHFRPDGTSAVRHWRWWTR
ncbi:hypothetical protein [Streptomyces sp. NBC_00347]|uniref:hypothetical protein n=1 Tax=Streptomyces sp. NBC_00347 TaxID=2975721 RepID=UPI00225AD715|nr:hypothetical protein [Streptomyces sp. NBC_00347]MCX5129428.1 hypothetical protein [Streptomyces sp. NBC_00347]